MARKTTKPKTTPKPKAEVTPETTDPATETSTDAGADAEQQAVAASAPAQNTPPESDVREAVTDVASPEAPAQDEDNPPESGPSEGAAGAVVETAAPNSPDLTSADKAEAINEAIAKVGEAAVFERLKDELCDPAFDVVIVGPRQGRWRAGRQFGQEPTIISADELTFEQFMSIHGDPMLLVQVVSKPIAIEA
ncbi:MAG: hypothetical protein AAFO86_06655 [Pseudomonadota bacterium]